MPKKKSSGKYKSNKFVITTAVVLILATAAFILVYFIGTDSPTEKGDDNLVSGAELYKFHKEGELTFRSAEGAFISSIDVELAETPAETERGMMSRLELTDKQGMLFIFEGDRLRSFWMRNTFIPLDLIFVNSKNEIVHIKKEAQPFDETSIPSQKPAQYVVEVMGGYTDKYDINVGDQIVWRRI